MPIINSTLIPLFRRNTKKRANFTPKKWTSIKDSVRALLFFFIWLQIIIHYWRVAHNEKNMLLTDINNNVSINSQEHRVTIPQICALYLSQMRISQTACAVVMSVWRFGKTFNVHGLGNFSSNWIKSEGNVFFNTHQKKKLFFCSFFYVFRVWYFVIAGSRDEQIRKLHFRQ